MPKNSHGIKAGGEPGKKTDGYYQLQTGPVNTNAAKNGGCPSPKVVPCGPNRCKIIKVKIP